MTQGDSSGYLQNLVSVYLTDYEKIRDEIRMRITQRHQFTNYSLLLFAGIFSVTGTMLGRVSGSLPDRITSLSTEHLLFLIVTPYIFYALLFMYIRHDFYIYHLTIFIEKHVAKQVRKIFKNHSNSEDKIDCSYLLGYEKYIQEIRQKNTKPGTFILTKTITDNLMKHFPFLFPVAIFIGLASVSVFCGSYHKVMLLSLVLDIICFTIGNLLKKGY